LQDLRQENGFFLKRAAFEALTFSALQDTIFPADKSSSLSCGGLFLSLSKYDEGAADQSIF
jgi:hypothetical protein